MNSIRTLLVLLLLPLFFISCAKESTCSKSPDWCKVMSPELLKRLDGLDPATIERLAKELDPEQLKKLESMSDEDLARFREFVTAAFAGDIKKMTDAQIAKASKHAMQSCLGRGEGIQPLVTERLASQDFESKKGFAMSTIVRLQKHGVRIPKSGDTPWFLHWGLLYHPRGYFAVLFRSDILPGTIFDVIFGGEAISLRTKTRVQYQLAIVDPVNCRIRRSKIQTVDERGIEAFIFQWVAIPDVEQVSKLTALPSQFLVGYLENDPLVSINVSPKNVDEVVSTIRQNLRHADKIDFNDFASDFASMF